MNVAISPGTSNEEGLLVGGRYILGRALGSGGLAYVRVATDRVLGRTVAVKCMHPALRRSADDVKRVQREGVIAASIVHPNVCATVDAGSLPDGSPYVVMEHLQGTSVEEKLVGGRFSLADALDIAIQTLAGLSAAHVAGVLHRDVKPANVFLVAKEGTPRPLVKVLDFGAAFSGGGSDLTPSGLMVGTPHYLAPEQACGARDLDQRVDVYGVGVLLYEMLSGRRAFLGVSYAELLRRVTSGNVEALSSVAPHLPASLVKMVGRAMCVDRDYRFTTAREFIDALASAYESATGQAYVPPWALVASAICVARENDQSEKDERQITAALDRGRRGSSVPPARGSEPRLPPAPPPLLGPIARSTPPPPRAAHPSDPAVTATLPIFVG